MKSPFKFLDSYTKDDRDIFFGREREIEELYQRIFESKIMLVYGVSGTGKSSLIHCGLSNKFSETDWLPLVVRRGANMNESMASAISSASLTVQKSKFSNPADFRKGVRSLYLDHYKPVFFIFDQFEELFIFGDKEERSTFVQIVKTITESDLQCRFIFVMREEYMASISEFEKFIPTIFSNRVRIEKMSHLNAIDAIKGPCKVFNICLEEDFAETLLEKLSPGSEDVELTYLQVFLDKVYKLAVSESEKQKGIKELSFSLYLLNKIGNVSDLLGSFLDEQIALMEDPDTALMILKSMVSIQGTKRQLTTEEIDENMISFGKRIERTQLIDMLAVFVNLRILRDKDENGKMELRHDALASKIYDKFTITEKELLEVRNYVENAFYNFERRDILLNRQDLDYLAEYENRLILPANLQFFVNQSKQKLQTSRKALRRITRVSTIIFLLILAVVLRFYISTQQGNNPENLFTSAMLSSLTDPAKGVIKELKIWDLDSTATQLHRIILEDFQRVLTSDADSADPVFQLQEYLKPVKLESEIIKAEISRDGKFLYGWMQNRKAFYCDLTSNTVHYIEGDGEPEHIELSLNNDYTALVYKDRKGTVYNNEGKKMFGFETSLNSAKNDKLVRFFPAGRDFMAVVRGDKACVLDSFGNIRYELNGHSGHINSLDISPDGRFIATAADDKNINIWNYNKELNKYSIYNSLTGHIEKVWSCRFNKTGKYVLSASADSSVRIWKLDGKQINPELSFRMSNVRYRLNNGEPDEDRSNPDHSKYYGKFCDASFSPGEFEIIATGYTETDDSSDSSLNFYKVLFFDITGGVYHAYGRSGFLTSDEDEKVIEQTLSDIKITANEKVVAAVDSSLSGISIIVGWGERIKYLNGANPMFSFDGGTIYWISGEKIFRTPVHPHEVKRLIEKFKVTNSAISNEKIRLLI